MKVEKTDFLLIAPVGIEINKNMAVSPRERVLLIAPVGIEINMLLKRYLKK